MKRFNYMNIMLYFIRNSYAHSSKPQMKTAVAAAAAAMRAKSFRNETLIMQQHQDGCSVTT